MDEPEVTQCLEQYFISRGLESIVQFNLFDHEDDSDERSFRVDLAFKPIATKGNRTLEKQQEDSNIFQEADKIIKESLSDLEDACIFKNANWREEPNPNPMVGLAVEIENQNDKYFLGSMLVASIAGRWGILVAPDCRATDLWINTIKRMIPKGRKRTIPSNIMIFKWPSIMDHIQNLNKLDRSNG